MQRSMEKEQQEQIEKERKRVISEAEWVLDREETHMEKPYSILIIYDICEFDKSF